MVQQPEFKFAIIKAYFENDCSPILTKRALRHTVWAKEAARLHRPQILRVVEKLKNTFTLLNKKPPGRNRTVITDKNIQRVKRQLDISPRRSIRSLSRQLKISTGTTWKILRKELAKYPFKIQLKQTQTPQNKVDRVDFANKIADLMEKDDNFLQNTLFTDEANFHLSGRVNRQNLRFWGDSNPHEAIKAPKSREKLIVWAGLGHNGGVIGPFFFEDEDGKPETVKTENYLQMLKKKVIPILKRRKCYESCVFMQDGAPPHCSREAIAWLKEHFPENRLISRNSDFNWPAYSPDLNPCDFYLWGFLKSRVYSDPYPQTLEQLKVNIEREMKKISKDTIESVVNNFSARTRHVLSKRGAWFEQIINY